MMKVSRYLGEDCIPRATWVVLGTASAVGIFFGSRSNSVEVGALLFTAIFIAWYSVETSKLVKETKRANALSSKTIEEMDSSRKDAFLPLLKVTISVGELGGQAGFRFRVNVTNIGKGPALDISSSIPTSRRGVSRVPIKNTNINESESGSFCVLPSGETLASRPSFAHVVVNDMTLSDLENVPETERRVAVSYKDIFGRSLRTTAPIAPEHLDGRVAEMEWKIKLPK